MLYYNTRYKLVRRVTALLAGWYWNLAAICVGCIDPDLYYSTLGLALIDRTSSQSHHPRTKPPITRTNTIGPSLRRFVMFRGRCCDKAAANAPIRNGLFHSTHPDFGK